MCRSVTKVPTPSPYLVCRLREINEQLSQLSTGEACVLFEQEVGAHTCTQKRGQVLYCTSVLAGSGTEEARTGGDNCCPGQRYLFLLSGKNWYNCTTPFSGWLLHNRRFSITYLKLKPLSSLLSLPPSHPSSSLLPPHNTHSVTVLCLHALCQ